MTEAHSDQTSINTIATETGPHYEGKEVEYSNELNTNTQRSKDKNENEVSENKHTMLRPPPHVYSCFVKNTTDHPIDMTLEWYGRPNEHEFDEFNQFTLGPGEEKHIQRKIFQPDLPKNSAEEFDHQKHSYCSWVKILNRVTVDHRGERNRRKVEVCYPFKNVPCPIRNWEFLVTDTSIESQFPTRPVNILKYENLTDFEK